MCFRNSQLVPHRIPSPRELATAGDNRDAPAVRRFDRGPETGHKVHIPGDSRGSGGQERPERRAGGEDGTPTSGRTTPQPLRAPLVLHRADDRVVATPARVASRADTGV